MVSFIVFYIWHAQQEMYWGLVSWGDRLLLWDDI